jgi:hypothetical protein
MIKVSVEVREGAALFRVSVQAENISRAMSIMKGRHPGRNVRVVYPIDPEKFFLHRPLPPARVPTMLLCFKGVSPGSSTLCCRLLFPPLLRKGVAAERIVNAI